MFASFFGFCIHTSLSGHFPHVGFQLNPWLLRQSSKLQRQATIFFGLNLTDAFCGLKLGARHARPSGYVIPGSVVRFFLKAAAASAGGAMDSSLCALGVRLQPARAPALRAVRGLDWGGGVAGLGEVGGGERGKGKEGKGTVG